MKTAIIIFAYNRPKYLKQMLASFNDAFMIDADIYAIIDIQIFKNKCYCKSVGCKCVYHIGKSGTHYNIWSKFSIRKLFNL